MPLGRILVLALIPWLGLTIGIGAQDFGSAEYVRDLYQKYLKRAPSATELNQWVWSFSKGITLTDAQATFLSSDEYFGRHGSNPQGFITALYADILNRAPSPEEMTQWSNNLIRLGGNRQVFVREFLQAAQKRASEKAPLPEIGDDGTRDQLVATAQLLRNAVEEETAATNRGRQLSIMARNLVDASFLLQRTAVNSADYRLQIGNVEVALNALERELLELQLPAPKSSVFLTQYSRIFSKLSGSVASSAPLPTAAQPVSGIDVNLYNRLIQSTTVLMTDVQQVTFLLRDGASANANQTALLRDLEFFAAQVQTFHQSLRLGMPQSEVRHEILRLRALSEGISQRMRVNALSVPVVERWNVVSLDMKELGQLIGISAGPTIDPGQPVLIYAPTYTQLPYQVQRPTAAQLTAQAISETDKAVAHVNALIIGFNQFLYLSPRVPGLQAQARSLQLSLTYLRQELTNNSTELQISSRLGEINNSFQELTRRWGLTVTQPPLANAPDLSAISASVRELNRIYTTSKS